MLVTRKQIIVIGVQIARNMVPNLYGLIARNNGKNVNVIVPGCVVYKNKQERQGSQIEPYS